MSEYWRPGYELMLEEARRSLDRQADRLQHARERSVGLVGFGALVAAALGLGEDSKPFGVSGAVAVGAFLVVTGCALWVVYPREFKFELSAQKIDAWFDDPELAGADHMLHTAALRHGEHHAYNHDKIRGMQRAITLGVLALSVETVALMVRLVV